MRRVSERKGLKAIDQRNHVTLVITITVCKVIKKLLTEIDFHYQTLVNKRANVCLLQKIY